MRVWGRWRGLLFERSMLRRYLFINYLGYKRKGKIPIKIHKFKSLTDFKNIYEQAGP